jgi:hypothetical protein
MDLLLSVKIGQYVFARSFLIEATSVASGGHISVLTEIWKRATKGCGL